MCASIPEAETEEKWSSPLWALSVAGRKQPSSSLLPLQLWTTEWIACKIAFLHVCKALSTAKVWLYNWRADINIASKEEISTGALCEWWNWPLPFQSMWRTGWEVLSELHAALRKACLKFKQGWWKQSFKCLFQVWCKTSFQCRNSHSKSIGVTTPVSLTTGQGRHPCATCLGNSTMKLPDAMQGGLHCNIDVAKGMAAPDWGVPAGRKQSQWGMGMHGNQHPCVALSIYAKLEVIIFHRVLTCTWYSSLLTFWMRSRCCRGPGCALLGGGCWAVGALGSTEALWAAGAAVLCSQAGHLLAAKLRAVIMQCGHLVSCWDGPAWLISTWNLDDSLVWIRRGLKPEPWIWTSSDFGKTPFWIWA